MDWFRRKKQKFEIFNESIWLRNIKKSKKSKKSPNSSSVVFEFRANQYDKYSTSQKEGYFRVFFLFFFDKPDKKQNVYSWINARGKFPL